LFQQCSEFTNTPCFRHHSVVVDGWVHGIDDGVAQGWIARWWNVDELGVSMTDVVAPALS
jgi:hypothetical protein